MALISGMLVSLAVTTAPVLQTDAPATQNREKAAQEMREAQFAKTMSGAHLLGRFTIDGMKDGNIPKPERYEIGEVSKVKGDTWKFTARIKYGKHDIRVPLMLRVTWADDTPVINMDDFTIPAMGTFSFRVLFHGDRYVGTWQHGKVGGHMFGKIEPKKAEETKKAGEEVEKK